MSKVILVCGKICAGKTTYAKKLAEEIGAVILSVDEITLALFGQHLGDKHDEMVEKTKKYLFGKAAEIISVGVNVILDWGFWTREERQYAVTFRKRCNYFHQRSFARTIAPDKPIYIAFVYSHAYIVNGGSISVLFCNVPRL